ncbi:DNA glycosylase [Amylocystis lapponica]|nr:DNA glycosylase [Amylocystis lapponica]
MAKKRRAPSDDDDDYNGPASDSSFEPRPPARRTRNTAKRKRTRPHSASIHVIARPRPLQDALLQWYAGVHETRAMPWRKPYNPTATAEERAQRAYEVWISEIMLQQTQVETVKPYYNKWMAKFPTIRDLAASDIETVNSLWKGLGYYSRAARLFSGAQKAVQTHGGRLPDNAKDMDAGAICSIAYNQCVPVLDGNVHRLLSRVLALYASPKAKQTLDVLWCAAAALVEGTTGRGTSTRASSSSARPSAKCATPHAALPAAGVVPGLSAPDVEGRGRCPTHGVSPRLLTAHSVFPQGQKQSGPSAKCRTSRTRARSARRSPPPRRPALSHAGHEEKAREELDIVSVVEWRAAAAGPRWFLLVRRPEGGLLAGLHEFPTTPNVPPTRAAPQAAHALLATLLASPPAPARTSGDRRAGSGALRIAQIAPAGDVLHVFSHIRKTYRAQWVLLEGGGPAPPALAADARGAWTPLAGVADANVGTGVLKVWARVRALW